MKRADLKPTVSFTYEWGNPLITVRDGLKS